MWVACGMNVCMCCVFASQHQGGPAGEQETHRAGKEAWDLGRVTGQTEGPCWYSGSPRMCTCLGI